MRYPTEELQLQRLIPAILWYNISARTLQACAYIATGVQLYAWQQDSCSLCLYAPNDGFTANDALLYKTKFGSVFPATVDTINTGIKFNKELIRNTTVLFDKLREYPHTGTLQWACCQAAKKEHKLRVKNFV